jgi:hypothetical protein
MCGECNPYTTRPIPAFADRVTAERAGFAAAVDHTIVEARRAERLLRRRDRHDFGMPCHVGILFDAVDGLAHHLAAKANQHAIRIFADGTRYLRKRDGSPHHPAVMLLERNPVHGSPAAEIDKSRPAASRDPGSRSSDAALRP